MPMRPNILLIITDQQSHAAMSCAGNDALRTPAMDSLAETGVLFRQAYCSYPLCTPSRAAIFTGRMPHEIGISGNNEPIAEPFRQEELGWLFQRAGYDCVYGGKWHVPEIAMPDREHGFRTICGFDDAHLGEACSTYLANYAAGDRAQPFFMVASFDNPHNICEWARHQVLPWGPVADAPTQDCPNLPLNYAIPAFEPEAIRWAQASERRVYPTVSFTPEDWRHYRQAYFRLVEKVDGEIGRILASLRAHDLEEQTLIVLTSDHGDGMGAHHWNQKSVLYDEVMRVPLIVSLKGVTRAGAQDDNHLVAQGLDLLPTLCDYAAIAPSDDLLGRSLRDLAEGREPDSWHRAVYAESRLAPRIEARMVRTQRHKYALYSYGKYREQLIDLANDPGEMVNLAVENRYADLLQQHRDLLWEWCLQTSDPFEKHDSHPDRPNLPGHEFEP
ncbi:MAG: sulfatase-like hydrolase/transferase [Anaerolineae bacterium]|nr:sulfatase-like hydrolase/transferase [Anaerolineae bacterium]